MSKLITSLIALSLLLSGCGANTMEPEGFAKAVFQSIKKDQADKFVNRYVIKTKQVTEMMQLMEKFITDPANSKDKTESAKRRVERMRQTTMKDFDTKIASAAKRSFIKAHAQARIAGLDWKNASFVKIIKEDRTRYGVTTSKIYFLVKSGTNTYRFRMKGCFKTSQGWKITRGFRYRGKVK